MQKKILKQNISKRVNTTPNDTTTTFAQYQQNVPPNRSPRKSWSSIAYNNKNFPDGKLGYELQSLTSNITTNSNSKLFGKGAMKFERPGQDVMARASQIVQ